MPTTTDTRFQPQPSLERAVAMLSEAGLPVSDLTAAHMTHFYFAGEAAAPTGLVGVEFFGPDALLRSLVVVPAERASGLGSALVAQAEAHAREQGAQAIYLLTTTAEQFFRRRGYADADRSSAPEAIRGSREFSQLCPSSSAFLTKRLTPERQPL